MKFSLQKSLYTLLAALTILSLVSTKANAQQGIGQNWFGVAHSRSDGSVQALYDSNSQRPLGGLFAPGFTRTLTILGGLNFPSAGTAEQFDNAPGIFATVLPDPSARALEDTGYAISFAFGRRHSRSLRSEIEVAVRGNDISTLAGTAAFAPTADQEPTVDGNVTATSLMKNFIVEFENNSRFTPYVGAGLGLSYIDVEFGEASSSAGEATFQDDQTLFTYQAIGGVATELSALADFVVEYRFLGTSEVEFDRLGQELSYNTSNLFFGLKLEY
jgi:opacity protein-like surface antigen